MTVHRPSQIVQRTRMTALVASAAFFMPAVWAHADENGNIPPAELANAPPRKDGRESYIQRHMASEHHIGAFDLGSFFSLHDLNRDGVWDRAEIEAIYGVHHSTSVKHSPTYEVHDEKANKITSEVMRKLDRDFDGLITKEEFTRAGPDGLPSFEQYGKNVLGHHYDEESEYFVHHEEVYHKTPDKQTKESYTHPEDIEHFAHHQKIEAEEERRERHAEGMPSMEEDARRKKEAELRGEKYVSPYEAQMPKEGSPTAPQHAYDEHAAHPYAQEESLQSTEHVFRTPEGVKVVKSDPVRADPGKPDTKEGHGHTGADTANKLPHRMEGETDEGYKDRLAAFEKSQQAEAAYARVNPDLASPGVDPKTGEPKQMAGESYEEFRRRAGRAKFEEKQRTEPFRPTSKQDLRKSAPYKYPPIQNRIKKSSFFGEF